MGFGVRLVYAYAVRIMTNLSNACVPGEYEQTLLAGDGMLLSWPIWAMGIGAWRVSCSMRQHGIRYEFEIHHNWIANWICIGRLRLNVDTIQCDKFVILVPKYSNWLLHKVHSTRQTIRIVHHRGQTCGRDGITFEYLRFESNAKTRWFHESMIDSGSNICKQHIGESQ